MSDLYNWIANAKNAIEQAPDMATLDSLRIKFLGKKSYLTLQMSKLNQLNREDRRATGIVMNKTKKQILKYFHKRKNILENIKLNTRLSDEAIDVSLPGKRMDNGSLHPITRTIDRIESFFRTLGFTVADGPEIEDEYHNFDALNIPFYHPARTEHDTFWLNKTHLLRTQTSSVQIRIMKNHSPPIRIIAPGRVYRNDYDQTHTPMFHQIEGLLIDKNITFSNLKGVLCNFLKFFFEKKIRIRFRTSYFPFTEPSAEVDIIDKNDEWLEVLGCGMVHPNVLRNVSVDPEIYSGFAFGIGMERLAMLRYGVNDLRAFFDNDLRFLKQFK